MTTAQEKQHQEIGEVKHPADAIVDRYASDKRMTLGDLRASIREAVDRVASWPEWKRNGSTASPDLLAALAATDAREAQLRKQDISWQVAFSEAHHRAEAEKVRADALAARLVRAEEVAYHVRELVRLEHEYDQVARGPYDRNDQVRMANLGCDIRSAKAKVLNAARDFLASSAPAPEDPT